MRSALLSYLLIPLFSGLAFSVCADSSVSFAPATELASTEVQSALMETKSSPVDLNVADSVTLQRELNGVGKAKAEAIVAYRNANGPFASIDELLEVKGIDSTLLDRNRDKLSVE